MILLPNRHIRLASALLAALTLATQPVHAELVLDWVTVGDPGNAADTTGAPNPCGAVASSFQIMKYEMTNTQYAAFLNAVAATDTYSLYNVNMGTNAYGGITRSGSSGSYTYTVKTNFGNKPVNYVSWFDAARMANWLQNGQGSGGTESGAYTLVGGQTNGTAPALNSGATYFIPSESQWYKAAYYKGGSSNAGYWDYATQSNMAPATVSSGSTGVGSAGSAGNFANYNNAANWNGQTGIQTAVGTNGGPSAYGAFDMSGNIGEWNDINGTPNANKGLRGGAFTTPTQFVDNLSATINNVSNPASTEFFTVGFRLAAVPVPEPSTWAMAAGGIAYAAWTAVRRRTRRQVA
ncbi:MAG: SUMF1/EgtB/PvdO family nonheme iron enzyme [Planctomycetes bacterium]|nr:SUMF1/EgtB/PvdO family nonheme iron enzyme [Planctomycetota bacterium]